MTNHSPLRYPGGKGKLAPYISAMLSMNDLEGGHYAEPFAGGAAVALDLLFSEQVKHIHINDLDPCVFAFWQAAVNHTEQFVSMIERVQVDVDTWLAAREVKKNPSAYRDDCLTLGFSTFFLNRTNRSGILNGGMIGGLAQKGEWKLDCRFNKEQLIERVRRVGFFRTRITVSNLDASVFLAENVQNIGPKSLVYIDPPYYVKGAYLYQNHFTHLDHVSLAECVGKLEKHAWLVSYDNVDQIRRIYSDFHQQQFSIGYSARNHGKGAEVMVYSPDLKRPENFFANKSELQHLRRHARDQSRLSLA